jgi:hypothetical protein
VSQIRHYLDEDAMDQVLLKALRARGIDVRTAFEDGMVGRTDSDQLRWATSQGRVLYSFNVGDFFRLHTALLTQGEVHAGLILVPQQRYSLGDQIRGVLRLIAAVPAEDIENRVEFLSAWK